MIGLQNLQGLFQHFDKVDVGVFAFFSLHSFLAAIALWTACRTGPGSYTEFLLYLAILLVRSANSLSARICFGASLDDAAFFAAILASLRALPLSLPVVTPPVATGPSSEIEEAATIGAGYDRMACPQMIAVSAGQLTKLSVSHIYC